jgi:hypothetical protein
MFIQTPIPIFSEKVNSFSQSIRYLDNKTIHHPYYERIINSPKRHIYKFA